MPFNPRVHFAKLNTAYKRWEALDSHIPTCSGIYVLTRCDENGIKYAYVGQAKNIKKRLAEHLLGYQWIDLSIKKHKLVSLSNPYGWTINKIIEVSDVRSLDAVEQDYISKMAINGYQMRNVTSGGQSTRLANINPSKAAKGYHDGLSQGYKNAIRDVAVFFDKYLNAVIKDKPNKIKERKLDEFKELIGGAKNDNGSNS